jgi:hypothetical protein
MKKKGKCVRCGELTETCLGGVFICKPCYEVRSSCCPEFGADDLASEMYSSPPPRASSKGRGNCPDE